MTTWRWGHEYNATDCRRQNWKMQLNWSACAMQMTRTIWCYLEDVLLCHTLAHGRTHAERRRARHLTTNLITFLVFNVNAKFWPETSVWTEHPMSKKLWRPAVRRPREWNSFIIDWFYFYRCPLRQIAFIIYNCIFKFIKVLGVYLSSNLAFCVVSQDYLKSRLYVVNGVLNFSWMFSIRFNSNLEMILMEIFFIKSSLTMHFLTTVSLNLSNLGFESMQKHSFYTISAISRAQLLIE